AGRGHRGRDGERGGSGHRRDPGRGGRAVRAGVRAHLQRRVHVRHHGIRAGLPAAGPPREARVSASEWRRAMNAGAGRYAWPASTRGGRLGPRPSTPPAIARERRDAAAWARWVAQRVGIRHVLVLLAVLIYPWVATPFFTFQIGAQALALGLIAL